MAASLDIEFEPKLAPTLEHHRYKVLKGGRGSGKSWHVARMLVLDAYAEKHRILCCREIQKSIRQSVISVLAKQIELLGLESFFDIQNNAIYGKNGSEFVFEGLRSNVTAIKSMEGISRVWVEEAESVSETSWRTLLPTIREAGAEIWITFNPYDELDSTYQRFVVDPPPDTVVVHIDYLDNPYLDSATVEEAELLQAKNPIMYEHIWLGQPLQNKDGAYYAEIMMQNKDQVTSVPVDNALPVNTVWDLGMSDATAIWWYQQHGQEIRVVNYYENNNHGLNHYINYLHEWRDKHNIVYQHHFAPHDISVREMGTGKSRHEVAQKMGINFIRVPRVDLMGGINTVRNILHRCWFDENNCREGIRCLKNYRKEFDERKGIFNEKPLHDWSSHGADAFRYLAVSLRNTQTRSAPIQASGFDIF
jgi:phage terminase large subunit